MILIGCLFSVAVPDYFVGYQEDTPSSVTLHVCQDDEDINEDEVRL